MNLLKKKHDSGETIKPTFFMGSKAVLVLITNLQGRSFQH